MKRFMGFAVLIVLQLGVAVGWLAYGAGEVTDSGEIWIQNLELSAEERQMQENLARWYNLNLAETGEGKPLDGYEQILFLENGLMCSVEFPQAENVLPVWHGARENQDRGLSHFARSSLPTGGKGDHTVLIGGEQVLEEMTLPKKGQHFCIHILGDTLIYRIVDVKTAKRGPVLSQTEKGENLCSIWIQMDADWVIIRGVREYTKGENGEKIG